MSITKKLKQEKTTGEDVYVFQFLGHNVCVCVHYQNFSTYRWYCHFDDDEYVNVPVLMRTLRVHKDKVYLGHWPSQRRGGTKVTVIQQVSPITP